MIFQREYLDLILVPSGLLIIFSYHIFLLYKNLNDSNSTVLGLENKDKEEWLQTLLQNGESGDYDRAVNVISSNTSAAIYLDTISLTLCSLIGTWLGSSSANNLLQSRKIYGDTSPLTIFLKDISLLSCLLLAFSGFVQAARHLDMVLVPCGLLIMFAYHLILLYRYLNLPHTTAMGFENNDKRAWVERIMQQAEKRDVGMALSVISSNTSAATFLASISLTLSSLIGAWLGNSTNNVFESELIYGDTSQSTISIKYISLLTCFLLAFSCFVQSARHFVHTNYLISTPGGDIPVKFVEAAVIKGGDFWSLGLRALYFAINLLLWFFGPIPMFVSSVIMVIILHYLDTNSTPLHRYEAPVKGVVEKFPQLVVDIEHSVG